jgi:hypothetical protein
MPGSGTWRSRACEGCHFSIRASEQARLWVPKTLSQPLIWPYSCRAKGRSSSAPGCARATYSGTFSTRATTIRLPGGAARVRLARPARPVRPHQGRRDPHLAPPGRRAPVGLEYTIGLVTCGFSLRLGLSCGDLVLAREPAEDLLSADPMPGEVDLGWPGVSVSGCELAGGAVRPGCVPRSPSARYRARHSYTQLRDTPCAAATSRTLSPSSTTALTT